MKLLTSFLIGLCCLTSTFISAQETMQTIQDSATGITFPKDITFQYDAKDYKLTATGVATRKKFFVKVYSIASYVEQGVTPQGDRFQDLLQSNKAKQLTMKWVYDATPQQVQSGFLDSLQNNLTSPAYQQLEGEITKFIQLFNKEAKKGDEYILRWIPDGTVVVYINDNKVGTVKNPEFAKALWSIWFGPKAVVNRDNLVSDWK